MLYSVFRTRCSVQSRVFHSSPLRKYAASRSPAKPQLPSSVPSARKTPSTGSLEASAKLRKVSLIEKLYNADSKLLYRAPKRLTTLRIQGWTLAALCLSYILYSLGIGRMYDSDTWRARDMKHPKVVAAAYWVIGTFLMGAGGLCLYRTTGHIHSIEIVKQLNATFLQVNVRSILPFRRYPIVLPPYNVHIDSRVVAMQHIPEWMTSKPLNESSPSAVTRSVVGNTAKAIPRFFYQFFVSARQFMSQEGVLSINIVQSTAGKKETTAGYHMDLDGEILTEPDGRKVVLWDVCTLKKPSTTYATS